MALSLTTIRYFTGQDPSHYTIDNRPLSDLEANDTILKEAIEELQDQNTTYVSEGNWNTLQVVIATNELRNKAFGYKIRLWALEDKTQTVGQTSTYMEYVILGYSDEAGITNILSSVAPISSAVTAPGSSELSAEVTGGIDTMTFTFTGYSGNNGLVLLRAERFNF